ncbi:MAG: ribosome maturation factor RimP [Deltaproteobacteria bacterium]|nr:MAG: ribosome maturation factor RimP [Deltaproteobacteria bacterium]
MPTNSITAKLLALCEPVVEAAGYELVDVEYRRESHGWVVRVFIDHAGARQAAPIGFDDCERVSRELGPVLDVEDPVPHAYHLEVSSPGISRPLRTAEHFRRAVGSTAKLALDRGLDGRRNFKGEIVEVDGDTVAVRVDDGRVYRLPLADLRSARLVPDWDEVLKTGTRHVSKG